MVWVWIPNQLLYKQKDKGGLNFRNLKVVNMAFIAKQIGRINYNPKSLVSRMLKALYFRDTNSLNAHLGYRPSPAWWGVAASEEWVSNCF